MATSSILGAERAPSQSEGRDVEALGPSDSSDSGSDVQGELDLASPSDLDNTLFGTVQPGLESDSDSAGTGERGAALADEEARAGNDIFPDRIQNLTDETSSAFGLSDAELDLIDMAALDELAAEDREENEDDDPEEQIDDSPS
ncbi:MAG: hypothetical protein JF606_20495 [Burkholderiales bacterium]|nr:hypothetical protein [Burkholderiales bacterium]